MSWRSPLTVADHDRSGGNRRTCREQGFQQIEHALHGSGAHQQVGDKSFSGFESGTDLFHGLYHVVVDDDLGICSFMDGCFRHCDPFFEFPVQDGVVQLG